MTKNITLFAIALIVAIAMAGNAAAFTEPIFGYVSTTAADGEVVVLWVENDRIDNPNNNMTVAIGHLATSDSYYFECIEPLLLGHGKNIGDSFTVTVAMLCDNPDTNTYHNDTGVTQIDTYGTSGPTTMPTMNIEPCSTPDPDLIVTDVLVNPGGTRDSILRVYVDQNNDISAVVQNNGPGNIADDFDVCFEADGVKIGCATVTGGLSAGANTTVSIDWTPTCANYPVMPGFPPQSLPLTINVTVDCNCSNCPTCPDGSCGTITESDETNNTFSKIIPAMQEHLGYDVIGGVVNNGYKSKNFDCDTTEEPLDQFKYYNLTGGGVEYNVSGAKISTFAPEATDTRVHHIDLPSGATVKDARLYVYWYDKWGNYKTYPTGCLANLNVNFSGTDLMPDAAYQDSKAFGYYQSPKGSSVFNVTSLVSGSGDYTAIVKNIEPITGNTTTLLGEMLVVVYDGADHGSEVQIWMLEGTDYLMAADDTHNSYDYSVSPEKATATVAFSGGSIDLANITARLITVVAQGMAPGSDMLFNGNVIKTNAWDAPTEVSGKINVEDVSVTSNLLASGNNMGFRDTGTGGMQASNAFLLVEKIDVFVEMDDYDEMSTPGTMVAPIMLRNIENYGTGTITVSYNSSVVHVTGVADGPFSTVYASNINNIAGTVNISALNNDGYSGDIEFARITFEAVGGDADNTELTLSVDKLADKDYNNLVYLIDDGLITLREGVPPTMNGGNSDPNPIIQTILSGRARPVDRAISTLSINVVDLGSGIDVDGVIIDLFSIGGDEATTMNYLGSGDYTFETNATDGINQIHNLVVTATDNNGNIATSTIALEVLRRGDVARNNNVDMGDALYIARQSVGLEQPTDTWLLVGDVVGEGGDEEGDNIVDMADALYISRLTVDLETEQP